MWSEFRVGKKLKSEFLTARLRQQIGNRICVGEVARSDLDFFQTTPTAKPVSGHWARVDRASGSRRLSYEFVHSKKYYGGRLWVSR